MTLLLAGLRGEGAGLTSVVGRTSGQVRTVVVNLLELDGQQYLVAPRGNTPWVRNIRAAGRAELRVRRRRQAVVPVELGDDEKPRIIREYLRRWTFEIGTFFEGIDEHATDEQVRAIAPAFRCSPCTRRRRPRDAAERPVVVRGSA